MDNYPPTDQVNPAAAAPAGMPGAQPTAMGGGMPAPFAMLQQLLGGGGGGQPQQGGGGLFGGGQGPLGGFLTPTRMAALSLILNRGNPVPGMPTIAQAMQMQQAEREAELERQQTEALLLHMGFPPELARIASRSKQNTTLAIKAREAQEAKAEEAKAKAAAQRVRDLYGDTGAPTAPDSRRPAPINPVTPADYATGVWPADPDITPGMDRPPIQSITNESIERELRKDDLPDYMRRNLERELQRRDRAEAATRPRARVAQTEDEQRQARYEWAIRNGYSEEAAKEYAATKKFPKTDLSSKEMEMVAKAELGLPNWRSMLSNFKTAQEINFDTFEDYTAKLRAAMIAQTPAKEYVDPKLKQKALNTIEWDNIMGLEAINKMSQVMKGATTEREMGEHLKRIADVSLPIELRRRSLTRLVFLVEEEIKIRENMARGIRDKTYFKKGGGESGKDPWEGYTIEEVPRSNKAPMR